MRKQYVNLDGLRGVAAVGVLTYHYGLWTHTIGIAEHGYIGVDFFFCLSGFILAHAYQAKLAARAIGLREFVVLRLIRLYPFIALSMLLGAAVVLVNTWAGNDTRHAAQTLWSDLALSLALFPQFLHGNGSTKLIYPLNGAAWSLFFELVANVGWAVLSPFLSTRHLVAAAVASFAALTFAAVMDHGMNFGLGPGINFFAGFPRVAFSFTMGLLCFRAHAHAGWRPRLGFLPAAALLAFAFLIPQSRWNPAFDLFCAAVAFPLITLAVANGENDRTGVLRPAMLLFGLLSYPIYALHSPLFWLCRALADAAGLQLQPSALPAIAVATGLLCYFLTKIYDAPLRAALNVLRHRPSPATA